MLDVHGCAGIHDNNTFTTDEPAVYTRHTRHPHTRHTRHGALNSRNVTDCTECTHVTNESYTHKPHEDTQSHATQHTHTYAHMHTRGQLQTPVSQASQRSFGLSEQGLAGLRLERSGLSVALAQPRWCVWAESLFRGSDVFFIPYCIGQADCLLPRCADAPNIVFSAHGKSTTQYAEHPEMHTIASPAHISIIRQSHIHTSQRLVYLGANLHAYLC